MLIALFLSSIVPVVGGLTGDGNLNNLAGAANSISAVMAGVVLGFTIWKQIERFHGVNDVSYVFWSFLPAFMAVTAIVLLFRLDCVPLVLAAGFAVSLSWFVFVHYYVYANRRPRFHIIPGGDVARMWKVEGLDLFEARELFCGRSNRAESDGFVVDFGHRHRQKTREFIADLTVHGVPVYHYKHLEERLTGKVSFELPHENTFGSLLPNLFYLKVKQGLDIIAAVALILLLAPLFILLAAAIFVCDGRPILFSQRRMGYRGRPFTAFKFRTMVQPAKALTETDAAHAMTQPGDPRITPLGRILREKRLDELPQLFNVLRGEMSMIGPRPEALELERIYRSRLANYAYRHAVRPGISGWAQVTQGHVTAVCDVEEKLKYDFYYIKNLSPWLDFLILLKTIRTVVVGFGAR
ncbi:MAG: sugar transferase [Pseudomonadota bacterium]